MISEQQFYNLWNDYDSIITNLDLKLTQFQIKNPKVDVSEQIQTINTLRLLRDSFHKLYHLCLVLDGNQGKWASEQKRLLNRISELEKELKETKENINF